METRIALVRHGCPYCLKLRKAINVINRHLPDLKRINVIDNFEYEFFGFKSHPVTDNIDQKRFKGYPFLFIDGIVIEPTETELLIVTLANILSDELIMPINVLGNEIPLHP